MFFWGILVSAYMIISYRNKVRADKNLAKVNWDTYKLKLSMSWWTGFLWASSNNLRRVDRLINSHSILG